MGRFSQGNARTASAPGRPSRRGKMAAEEVTCGRSGSPSCRPPRSHSTATRRSIASSGWRARPRAPVPDSRSSRRRSWAAIRRAPTSRSASAGAPTPAGSGSGAITPRRSTFRDRPSTGSARSPARTICTSSSASSSANAPRFTAPSSSSARTGAPRHASQGHADRDGAGRLGLRRRLDAAGHRDAARPDRRGHLLGELHAPAPPRDVPAGHRALLRPDRRRPRDVAPDDAPHRARGSLLRALGGPVRPPFRLPTGLSGRGRTTRRRCSSAAGA